MITTTVHDNYLREDEILNTVIMGKKLVLYRDGDEISILDSYVSFSL